ncbi:MAG: hypothetical protein NTV06_06990 [candidate division Zixibacteria bacterium]|nr:hypothetical protein [candidate division Zixibacteria bacterium]
MFRVKSISAYIFLITLFICLQAKAGNGVMVTISTPDCPYHDSKLSEKLDLLLSTITTAPIIRPAAESLKSADFKELVNRGRQFGGRFLVDIIIDKIDLVKRKITVIPLTIYRYQIFAVLDGTMRIIDIDKSRIITMDKIDYNIKASDQWQFIDDDSNDPALMIPSDEKITILSRLEDKAAAGLFDEILKLAKGNHFKGKE